MFLFGEVKVASSSQTYTRASITDNLHKVRMGGALSASSVLGINAGEELRVVLGVCAQLIGAVTVQTDHVKQNLPSLGSHLIIFSLLPVRDA